MTDKAIRQYTMLELFRRSFLHDERFTEPEEGSAHKIVDSALSIDSTKLERVAAFQLAASVYCTGVNSPLDRMWPSMIEDDHELAIDILIDSWFKNHTIVDKFLLPHLQTTHHPERLRQLLGVLACESLETLGIAVESAEKPQRWSRKDRVELRTKSIDQYNHIAENLKRFVTMGYRADEVREFAISIKAEIEGAAAKGLFTSRQAVACARPFEGIARVPIPRSGAPFILRRHAPRNG